MCKVKVIICIMFHKHIDGCKVTILIVYLDDIILTGNDFVEMENLKRQFAKEFEIKILGDL